MSAGELLFFAAGTMLGGTVGALVMAIFQLGHGQRTTGPTLARRMDPAHPALRDP